MRGLLSGHSHMAMSAKKTRVTLVWTFFTARHRLLIRRFWRTGDFAFCKNKLGSGCRYGSLAFWAPFADQQQDPVNLLLIKTFAMAGSRVFNIQNFLFMFQSIEVKSFSKSCFSKTNFSKCCFSKKVWGSRYFRKLWWSIWRRSYQYA